MAIAIVACYAIARESRYRYCNVDPGIIDSVLNPGTRIILEYSSMAWCCLARYGIQWVPAWVLQARQAIAILIPFTRVVPVFNTAIAIPPPFPPLPQ